MAKNLHSFLKEYEEQYPEDVIHIEKEVDTDQEITAIVERLEALNKYPVLIFENMLNEGGKQSQYPLVTNLLASRIRYARICNSTYERLGRDVHRQLIEEKREPQVISSEESPVKEVVKTGDQVDLFELPLAIHNTMDAGRYIAAGFFTTYDPDSGIDNCAIQRGWVKEKNQIRALVAPRPGHNGWNLHKHEIKNQDMRAVMWIGHHPLAYTGGLAKLPYPGSHWEAMGGMLGEPLRLVASESLGDDFLVPADAEVVIEGFVEANKRYAEGPFGEFPGYYGGQIINPQLTVTAVTHRKDLIWYDIVAGHTDHLMTGAPPLEGMLWEKLRPIFPSLVNVHMPLSGTGRFHAYLQMKNPPLGAAKQAILQALTVNPFLIKHAFAFDDDVDIFSPRDVMWAIATRSQWARDVTLLPGTKQTALDPSRLWGPGDAGGIDCTRPWGEPYEQRVGVDPEILEKTQLEDYISSEALAGVSFETY